MESTKLKLTQVHNAEAERGNSRYQWDLRHPHGKKWRRHWSRALQNEEYFSRPKRAWTAPPPRTPNTHQGPRVKKGSVVCGNLVSFRTVPGGWRTGLCSVTLELLPLCLLFTRCKTVLAALASPKPLPTFSSFLRSVVTSITFSFTARS